MRRLAFLGSLLAALAFGASARAQTPEPAPRMWGFQIAPGFKSLFKDPVAGLVPGDNGSSPQMTELGVGVAVILLPPRWPVSLTLSGLYAGSSHNRVTSRGAIDEQADTIELGLGVRKTWAGERSHAFVGGGLALCNAHVTDEGADGSSGWGSGSSGAFIEGAAFLRPRPTPFDVGLLARFSTFPSERFPFTKAAAFNAGGLFIGLLLGYGP